MGDVIFVIEGTWFWSEYIRVDLRECTILRSVAHY